MILYKSLILFIPYKLVNNCQYFPCSYNKSSILNWLLLNTCFQNVEKIKRKDINKILSYISTLYESSTDYIYGIIIITISYEKLASIGSFFTPNWNDMFLWDPAVSVAYMRFSFSGYMEACYTC